MDISHSSSADPVRVPAWQRWLLVGAGGVLLFLLGTAAVLEPDPRGLGTHQQLGFPPCSFRQYLGIRCPACGMTTSWSHFTRGQLMSAASANFAGTLLALVAVVVGPWSVVSGLRGKWCGRPPADWIVALAAAVLLLVSIIEWGGRLLVSSGS